MSPLQVIDSSVCSNLPLSPSCVFFFQFYYCTLQLQHFSFGPFFLKILYLDWYCLFGDIVLIVSFKSLYMVSFHFLSTFKILNWKSLCGRYRCGLPQRQVLFIDFFSLYISHTKTNKKLWLFAYFMMFCWKLAILNIKIWQLLKSNAALSSGGLLLFVMFACLYGDF